ncbi:MAG: Smr/MutS family protein, partial [Vicinamibacterales bacterium]
HITNVVSMDRTLTLPSLILLDEVGAGTDPVEGGALGTAVIDHFRRRGSHLVATTHYDSLKSYASTTDGVAGAAFGFNPESFAPTYKLLYGSPGRSLAIEIAARLGMPREVIASARENLSEREQQLAEHLARVDDDLRRLERERKQATAERLAVADAERKLKAREAAVRDREETFRKRLDSRLEDQVRAARREIDTVIDGLKARAAELSQQAAVRLRSGEKTVAAGISTGETGAARADARAALDDVVARLKEGAGVALPSAAPTDARRDVIEVGSRVTVGALGIEGVVVELYGKHAEVDVRGKRLRAALRDLRGAGAARGGAASEGRPAVRVNIDLQPRTGSLTELNVIGNTVDEALTRLEKFLDETLTTDIREVRIVHGHGTGQLRRAIGAFLKEHPLVTKFDAAPQNQGGGGATIVELKD